MQTDDSLADCGNSNDEGINELSVDCIGLDSLVEYEWEFVFCVINDISNFPRVRFESGSEFSKPVVSVVFFLVAFLLSFFFSGLFRFFGASAILFETEFGLHDKPKNRKQDGKGQLNPTNYPHDKLVLVVVVSEVWCLFNCVMVHYNEIKHKRANEIRNVSRSLSDAINDIWGNRKVVLPSILSERLQLQVIKLVVLLNLLFYVLVITEQWDKFIPLSVPTYLQHDRVLRVLGQIFEHWMMWEVQVLKGRLSPIIWRYFNLDDQSLEFLHKNIKVFVLLLAIRHQINSEILRLQSFLILCNVWIFLV